jgi:hypothetical protein
MRLKGYENAPKFLAIEGLAMLGGGVLVLAILSPGFWHVLYLIIIGVATVAVLLFVGICLVGLLFTSLRLDRPIRRMPPKSPKHGSAVS